jgi:hypothetical protein
MVDIAEKLSEARLRLHGYTLRRDKAVKQNYQIHYSMRKSDKCVGFVWDTRLCRKVE